MLGPMARGEETTNVLQTSSRPAFATPDLCRADCDWDHHIARAKQAGLTDEEIQRIPKGPDARGWSRFDALLLRAADELHADQFIKDTTWKGLADRYNELQLMDTVFTVGQYTMVSMFLNSAGVQLEPVFAGLPK